MKQNSNIHVFRVNRFKKAKEKQQNNANASPAAINSRTSLSAETKRLICEDHSSNPKYTQEALAKKYGCKRTTVAKIIKSKERWLSIATDTATAKRFRQRSSRYPLVENALVSWLEKEEQNLAGITDQMLRCQARQYAQSFSLEGSSASEDFKASSSWVANFKQRFLTPKLAKLEHRSPKPDSGFGVPESMSSRKQQKNAINDFTSVFSIEPPMTHVNALVPDLTSNSIIADKNNNMPTKDEWSSAQATGSIAESSASAAESDQVSVISSTGSEEEKEDSEVLSDQNAIDYTDSFDLENETDEPTNVNTQQAEQQTDISVSNSPKDTESGSPLPALLPQQQQQQQQQINSKLSAKEHLEAALAFYTNQSGASTSMSANMIKLILQNDFV
ncbi:hypothetical protein [Parasitella parasitica]|uniref:HTH CENPB-type domain-containing protein n=1 Tax=Parasitella parasitica TaxID=35722 RepID=A0A0B7NLI3_9FUNG|nr:hypothetical protein [Parasitella parasitica]